MSAVAVIGAGGHAKVVVSTLRAAGHAEVELYDDREALWGTSLLGATIVAAPASLRDSGRRAVIAVGNNDVRRRLAVELGLEWLSVVHPHAWVHESVLLGAGTVVFAGAVVQPDTRIGDHCIVNTSASIDHDCRIGDFTHVAPGVHLCGGVSVDEGVLLGVASAARPGVRIGAWATVAAGAVCVRDVPANGTVMGVPARAFDRAKG